MTKPQAIIEFLLLFPNKVISYPMLYRRIWKDHFTPCRMNTIYAAIHSARKTLRIDKIVTVKNNGIKLIQGKNL